MKGNPVFDRFNWWDEKDVLTQITPDRLRYLFRVAGPLEERRVLDLGCGGGMLAEPLARAGARVVATDLSAHALGVASAHAAASGATVTYLRAPAERLPLANGTIDLAVVFDVLEHVNDLPATINEVSRVLKPGGKLVYDTMNRTLLCRLVAIWIGERLWKGGPPRGTHDWHRFVKPAELGGLLDRSGIENVETRGFLPVGVGFAGRLHMVIAPTSLISYVGYGVKRGNGR